MFDMIQWQEQTATALLSKSSFTRMFAGDSYATTGMCKAGRRATGAKLRKELQARGYTEEQAIAIVRDVITYAKLLYNAA